MKKNRSFTYVLPLISELVNLPRNILKESLLNVYLEDSINKHQECIYLYFNYDIKNKHFTHFENELFNNELFVTSYDINDKVLYVVKIPEEYKDEYYLYKNGVYSKYADDAKLLVLKFITNYMGGLQEKTMPIINKIKKVLNKDVKLKGLLEEQLKVKLHKDQELGEGYNKKLETFNYNKITEYENKNKKIISQSNTTNLFN